MVCLLGMSQSILPPDACVGDKPVSMYVVQVEEAGGWEDSITGQFGASPLGLEAAKAFRRQLPSYRTRIIKRTEEVIG